MSSSLLRQEMEKREPGPVAVASSSSSETEKDEHNIFSKSSDTKPTTYTVCPGDTLMAVSTRTNLSIPALKKYNKLYGRNSLYTGQVLQLTDPALQPSTWTDASVSSMEERDGGAQALLRREDSSPRNFVSLKDKSSNDMSFIEKHRLKSKSLSSRNLDVPSSPSTMLPDMSTRDAPPPPPPVPSTPSPRPIPVPGALKPSSSFKYRHNSNPDLKSLCDQSSPTFSDAPEIQPLRRQSSVRERDRLPGSDWTILGDLENAPHDTVIATPSQPTPNGGASFSLSSVPKALLLGTMEIFDSYFPSSFTPPVSGLLSKAEGSSTAKATSSAVTDSTGRKFRSFHTELHGTSSILLHSHIQCLVDHFPTGIQHDAWELLYSTELHGSDLVSFYSRSGVCAYTLLVVRTDDNQIFGGFATEPWKMTKHGREAFYGTGQCFLFRCHPVQDGDENEYPEDENVDVFPWQYDNYFFQWSNSKQIAMGGGGGQFGFVIDDDFAYAETNPCDTFGNPHLTTHTSPFKVAEVELWGFGGAGLSAQLKKKKDESVRSREHKYVMSYESH